MRLTVTSLALVLLIALTSVSAGFKPTKQVNLASFAYGPYSNYDEDRGQHGLVLEIIKMSFESQGYIVNIDFLPHLRCIEMTKIGDYDGFFPVEHMIGLDSIFAYSEPIYDLNIGYCTKKDFKLDIEQKEDLSNFTVGTVLGKEYNHELDHLTTVQQDMVRDDLLNMKKLYTDRVDVILIDKYIAKYLLKNDLSEIADQFEFEQSLLIQTNQYLAMNRNLVGTNAKLQAFNNGLDEIVRDGTFNRLITQHIRSLGIE